MNALELLRKYQRRASDGSLLPVPRTNRDFAALLGVHESYLSKCYDGQIPVGMKALRGLRRAFPCSVGEVTAVILASLDGVPEDESEPVAVAGD
jgi:hypothetical protein